MEYKKERLSSVFMKLTIILAGLFIALSSLAKENEPSQHYLNNTIDFLRKEPVSLFDWGMSRLRERLVKLDVGNLIDSEMVVVMLRYSLKNNKIYIETEEQSLKKNDHIFTPKVNRPERVAKELCKSTVISIKEKLGLLTRLSHDPKSQLFYASTYIGGLFKHEYADQTNAAFMGEQIMEIIEIQSIVRASEQSVICKGSLRDNEIEYTN